MSATVQANPIPERIVTHRGVAALFVLFSAWSLYQRVRHVSDRFRVPEPVWTFQVLHGAVAVALELMFTGLVILMMLGLFGSTRNRVERAGIVACLGNLIFRPLQIYFPAYTAAIWWVDLGFLLTFLLAAIAVLVKLSRPDYGSDHLVDPPATN